MDKQFSQPILHLSYNKKSRIVTHHSVTILLIYLQSWNSGEER